MSEVVTKIGEIIDFAWMIYEDWRHERHLFGKVYVVAILPKSIYIENNDEKRTTIRHVRHKEIMQVFPGEVVRCQGLVRALLVVAHHEVTLPSRLAHLGEKQSSVAISAQKCLSAQAQFGLKLCSPDSSAGNVDLG